MSVVSMMSVYHRGPKVTQGFLHWSTGRLVSRIYRVSNKKAKFPPILTLGARENSNASNVKIGGKFAFLFEHPVFL